MRNEAPICHFIAINVVVGAATDADEVITFRPDNGSVTRILADNSKLLVIELGCEAEMWVY